MVKKKRQITLKLNLLFTIDILRKIILIKCDKIQKDGS